MAKNLPLDIQNKVALAISEGLITGVKHFAQFGYNPNLSSGVEAAMWSGSTPLYVFPNDAGESMRLKGGNVADNQTMLIQALDQDWNEVNIPLALNGITPVVIPGNLARINRVIVIEGVSPLSPKSDVVLLASADANTTDVSARTPFTLYKV